jgi:hypothetical protein
MVSAPAFKIIHAQPRIKLSGKQQPIKTHAFSVQVQAKDATKMNQFLRKIYEDEHLYMPYSMKQKFPQAVAQAMLKQNKLIKETWVVVLVGVHRSIMPKLETTLLASMGVISISNTNRTDKTGRWHVIVHESYFKAIIRKRYTVYLKAWFRDLPEDQLDSIPAGFPIPHIYQKHGYDDDDDSSSGHASYMSSCAQSYGSFEDNIGDDHQYFNPPGPHRSYAAALGGIPAPPIAVPEVHVCTRCPQGLTPETNLEVKEYHTVIAGTGQS